MISTGLSQGQLQLSLVKQMHEFDFFLSNLSKLFNFSAIFVPVTFCKFLPTWSSLLSTMLCSKYLQSNFEVLGPLRSLGLTYTVVADVAS